MRMLVLQSFHFSYGPATYRYEPGEQELIPAAAQFAEANGYATRCEIGGAGMLYARAAGTDDAFVALGPVTSINLTREKRRAARHPKTP